MYHHDVQQNPDFYWPNFKKTTKKRDAKYSYVYTGPHLIMLPFHFECTQSGNFKSFVSPESWHCILVWNSKCILYVLTCNTDFQGSMKLKKIKQSYLSGMNLTDVSSVLLGKFGMQKKKLLQIPKNVH